MLLGTWLFQSRLGRVLVTRPVKLYSTELTTILKDLHSWFRHSFWNGRVWFLVTPRHRYCYYNYSRCTDVKQSFIFVDASWSKLLIVGWDRHRFQFIVFSHGSSVLSYREIASYYRYHHARFSSRLSSNAFWNRIDRFHTQYQQ